MTTTITFLGGEETGNAGSCKWGDYNFILNKPVPCTDPHILDKATKNRFFMVGNDMIGPDVVEADVVEQAPPKKRGRPKKVAVDAEPAPE